MTTTARVAAGAIAGAVLIAVTGIGVEQVSAAPVTPTQCSMADTADLVLLTCGYAVETPGAPAPAPTREEPSASAAASQTPTATWVRDRLNRRLLDGDANTLSTTACTTPDGQPGTPYRDTLITASGEILQTNIACVGDQQPAPNAAAEPALPAPPPPPPTREELASSAPVPDPVIRRDPADRGLVGLETRFWADVGTTVEASVTVRGWTVAGTLGVGSLDWATGDGGRYQTASPGTSDAPALQHTYGQDGTWPVAVDMAWSGSYTISGYGTSYTVDGLTATGTATLDYEVIEVRAVLDDAVS